MTVLWSDSRAEFTPVYNGVVRALFTPDDYNQQPFRETTPPGRVYSLFYFPFERCEPPRDRNHGAVCGYLCNCLTNTRGRARAPPCYFRIFFFAGLHGLVVRGLRELVGTGRKTISVMFHVLITNDPRRPRIPLFRLEHNGTVIYFATALFR